MLKKLKSVSIALLVSDIELIDKMVSEEERSRSNVLRRIIHNHLKEVRKKSNKVADVM